MISGLRHLAAAALVLGAGVAEARAEPSAWAREWPRTDFTDASVDLSEILSGGPPRDGIPAIDNPVLVPAADVEDLPGIEPVISVAVGDDAHAYPLRILTWHEIVNTEVGGKPLVVTFCPLCNTGLVFERNIDGVVHDFGVTGKLRNSDLIMYDRQTESWWQQFTGTAIVGTMNGRHLVAHPVRMESFERFRQRHPGGKVQIPGDDHGRPYGLNPYAGYDSRDEPYPFFRGDLPSAVAPLSRVVRVGERAWSLALLRELGRIEDGPLTISWEPGQASALDSREIAAGFDVGNVVVRRITGDGPVDVVHTIDFAFAFHAFYPEGEIVTRP